MYFNKSMRYWESNNPFEILSFTQQEEESKMKFWE